jgi:hypothetical protein
VKLNNLASNQRLSATLLLCLYVRESRVQALF